MTSIQRLRLGVGMTAEAIMPTRRADSVTGGGRDDTDREPPAQGLDGLGRPSVPERRGAPPWARLWIFPSHGIAVPRATVTVGPDPLARAVAVHSAARLRLDVALDEREREQPVVHWLTQRSAKRETERRDSHWASRARAPRRPGPGVTITPSAG